MSRRLTDTRQGKAAPTLSLRLTEAMAAEIEQARAALALAAPTGLVVSLSDAAARGCRRPTRDRATLG